VAFKGWRFLIRELRDPAKRDFKSWIDLACMIAHWVIWTIIPIFIFGFANVAMFFMVHMFIMSYIMFALFAPAHYPVEAIQITSAARRDDYLMLQTATAINFTTGPIGRLLCGGVEYQIEHHLFPWISTTHYPVLSPLVKTFCDEHGYPYRSQSWARGLWASYLTMWRPKPIYDEFPSVSQSREEPAAARQTASAMGDLSRA
jgi:fatty acid desaturase